MRQGATSGLRFTTFETALGWCAIAWSQRGVARFRLPDPSERATEARMRALASPGAPPAYVSDAIALSKRYFDGEDVSFDGVPLDFSGVEAFSLKLYEAIRALRRGQTTTYGALAQSLGAPKEAARAVGQAMGSNPIPLIVPCHRVLGAGDTIGGFSAPGGSKSKARMLAMEGVRLNKADPSQNAFDF